MNSPCVVLCSNVHQPRHSIETHCRSLGEALFVNNGSVREAFSREASELCLTTDTCSELLCLESVNDFMPLGWGEEG